MPVLRELALLTFLQKTSGSVQTLHLAPSILVLRSSRMATAFLGHRSGGVHSCSLRIKGSCMATVTVSQMARIARDPGVGRSRARIQRCPHRVKRVAPLPRTEQATECIEMPLPLYNEGR